MKVEEAIKLINNSWNCYSLESAGYLLTGCKLVNRQDYNNSNRWYIMATDIYKVDDGYIGVRGVLGLKSGTMNYSDTNEHCIAEEYKAVPTITYMPKLNNYDRENGIYDDNTNSQWISIILVQT